MIQVFEINIQFLEYTITPCHKNSGSQYFGNEKSYQIFSDISDFQNNSENCAKTSEYLLPISRKRKEPRDTGIDGVKTKRFSVPFQILENAYLLQISLNGKEIRWWQNDRIFRLAKIS